MRPNEPYDFPEMNGSPQTPGVTALGRPLTQVGYLKAFPLNPSRPEDARQFYREEGYLYLNNILPREKVLSFRAFYFEQFRAAGLLQPGSIGGDGLFSGVEPSAPIKNQILRAIVRSPEYEALCAAPEIISFYQWFLGGAVHLHKRKLVRHTVPQGPPATGAHYDLVYIDQGTENICTSWIPLGDLPLNTGTLIYLEKSHLLPVESLRGAFPDFPAQAGWITRDLESLSHHTARRWLVNPFFEAGDMMVHGPRMIHATADMHNSQGIMRLSTDIRYQAKSEPLDPRWQNHWREDDGL